MTPIRELSVTQVEGFDAKQKGGCARRWWFKYVQKIPEGTSFAKEDGIAGHALLARYLADGTKPGRTRMSKAVNGAIEKGELPTPGPDLHIERCFDGGPHTEGWRPLITESTLWLGGFPWRGAIDLSFRRGDVPEVWDHKFSADIHANAKPADGLIKTVQLPVYVLERARFWPDARRWRIAHHNVSRNGVDSFIVADVVDWDQILERKADIEDVISEMVDVSGITAEDDVPANTKSCDAWFGCPYQSRCSAFKRRGQVSLSADELALFDDVAPEVKTEVAPPAVPEKVVEAMTAQIAAVIPPDAPVNSAAVPPPKRKPGRPPKSKIVDVQEGETEAQAEARSREADWVMVTCKVCGADMGKRPPGHSIDPMFCPKKAAHPVIAAPAPSASEQVLTAVFGPASALAPVTPVEVTYTPDPKAVEAGFVPVVTVDFTNVPAPKVEQISRVQIPDSTLARIARALRAAADALEQP